MSHTETTETTETESTTNFVTGLAKTFTQNAAAAAGLWAGMAGVAYGAKKLLDRRAAREAEAQTAETPTNES